MAGNHIIQKLAPATGELLEWQDRSDKVKLEGRTNNKVENMSHWEAIFQPLLKAIEENDEKSLNEILNRPFWKKIDSFVRNPSHLDEQFSEEDLQKINSWLNATISELMQLPSQIDLQKQQITSLDAHESIQYRLLHLTAYLRNLAIQCRQHLANSDCSAWNIYSQLDIPPNGTVLEYLIRPAGGRSICWMHYALKKEVSTDLECYL